MRRLVVLLIGWLVMAPLPAAAQIFGTGVMPVVEVGANLYQSTITAVQSVAQTINMVWELTPVDELIVAQGIAQDMALLGDILAQAEELSNDLASLNAQITVLFDLGNAPDTRAGLDQRLIEMQRVIYQTRTYAMRVQTLITTVFRTIDHLRGLLDSVGMLVGNMQGNQRLIEVQSTVSQTLAVQMAMNAAWQRTDTVDRLSEGVILESLRKISLKRLADHPRY